MILDKARDLGIAISTTEEFLDLTAAKEAMDADKELCASVNEFNNMQNRMMEYLSADNVDRQQIADLSQEIDLLQNQLVNNEVFSAYLAAQSRFQRMMAQINREIAACIGVETEEEDCAGSDGCSGSCSSCGFSCSMH